VDTGATLIVGSKKRERSRSVGEERPSLLITMDVEADMPRWKIENPLSFRNLEALAAFHHHCERWGVRPTYMVEYAVTEDTRATAILRDLHQTGGCEIGAHLHPWSCPPFSSGERQRIDFPSNLPEERLAAKLETLTTRLTEVFGTPPRSYRAGKFGLNDRMPPLLARCGYLADTSITPMVDWRELGGPDFSSEGPGPRWLGNGPDSLVEVPVGIVLTRRLPAPLRRLYLSTPRCLHFRGILGWEYLNWIDLVWLYPALFSAKQMIVGCNRLVEEGVPVLNVFLHSSELEPGQSPYTRTTDDVDRYLERLARVVDHARDHLQARCETLSEFAERYHKETGRERLGHFVAGYR
jgi:hypothetical protein